MLERGLEVTSPRLRVNPDTRHDGWPSWHPLSLVPGAALQGPVMRALWGGQGVAGGAGSPYSLSQEVLSLEDRETWFLSGRSSWFWTFMSCFGFCNLSW